MPGLYLHVASSPGVDEIGHTMQLGDSDLVLGRGGGMGLVDRRLSKRHCRITPVSGGYRLADLDSRNGTFLDGRAVKTAYLAPNAVLRIGDTVLIVDQDPPTDRFPCHPNDEEADVPEIAGASRTTRAVQATVATAAPTKGPVLVLGPTGTGKEVVARALHRLSGRGGDFVPVNCAALVSDLAETELFGHRRGAFTGAVAGREGLFARAHAGTLFLDEIGDMPLELQAKLLRVLEDGEVRPVGGESARSVDVRVVAATNRAVNAAGFRDDLRERLAEWVIRWPSLAERRADVLPLWWHVVARHVPEAARPGSDADAAYTAEFAEALLLHDWPGNVRELEKLVRRLSRLAQGTTTWDLPLLPSAMQRPIRLRTTGTDAEAARVHIVEKLREARGNVKRAAAALGYPHRNQLYRQLERLRIDPKEFR